MFNLRQVIYESVDPCVPPEYSFIRGLHVLPELPPIDVYINGMLRAKNFKYKDMSPYMPSGFESYDVQIFLADTKDNPILDIKGFKTERGQIITFAVLGSSSDIKLLPILDDINETIRPDETKIRFYNLDSSPITFDMGLPSGSISRSLPSGEGTDYTLINPGNHRFEVRSTNPAIKPISMQVVLNPGRIYTLYLTGSINPDSSFYAQGNIPQVILSVDGNTFLNKCVFM
jgi:Domain of unknown function (DUF4397)